MVLNRPLKGISSLCKWLHCRVVLFLENNHPSLGCRKMHRMYEQVGTVCSNQQKQQKDMNAVILTLLN